MFSVNSYLKVWKIKDVKEKYMEAQCSTSKKVADGQYETDFSGFVRFVGHAFNQVKNAKEGDSFKILQCGVTTQYVKEKNITYTNYVVFEVEPSNNNGSGQNNQSTKANKNIDFMSIPDDISEELPFN